MGRLAGFSYRQIARKLGKAGFLFDRRRKGPHEIWRNSTTGARTTVPRHTGDLPEGTLAGILKEAGLSVDEFLDF